MDARPPEYDPLREAEAAIMGHPLVRGHESLPDGECYVVAHSIMRPIYISAPITQTVNLSDRPQTLTVEISPATAPPAREIRPPNGLVVYKFTEPARDRLLYGMWLGAKRVRNYLSFLTGVPVPIRYAFVAKTMLWQDRDDVEQIMRYHPRPVHEDEQASEGWYSRLRATYPKAELLLRELGPMTPLGRAVSLVGDSVWEGDIEESFLYAWRAIDVVAKLDYDAVRKLPAGPEREVALAPYGSTGGGPDAVDCNGRVSISRKIRVTVAKRAPEFSPELTRRYNTLRGTVAHDTVDVDQLREIADARWKAQSLARGIVISAIPGARLAE